MKEVMLQPHEPDKELPFLTINLFSFPSESAAKEYEREINKWWPNLHLFVGRVSGDSAGKYTHSMVWRFKDFAELRRNCELYSTMLTKNDKSPLGDFPAYLFDHSHSFRVVDQNDPVLLEHGLEEWERRLNAEMAKAAYADPERARQWMKAIQEKFERDWGSAAAGFTMSK